LRPGATTLSTAFPQKQLAETWYFFPSPAGGLNPQHDYPLGCRFN